MASNTNVTMIQTFKRVIGYPGGKGCKPKLSLMEGIHSRIDIGYIDQHDMDIQQLGAPCRNHHLNVAEKSITMFTECFIAELAALGIDRALRLGWNTLHSHLTKRLRDETDPYGIKFINELITKVKFILFFSDINRS